MRAVIIGGTGTLGQATTKRLLAEGHWVLCVSRCELKQKETQKEFQNHPKLHFSLGDIRDREQMIRLTEGADVVFHFAALKHVDVMEENPEESIKTNVIGTMNVADACEINRVPNMVFSSTDKAVDPINVYGFSKALSEKLLLNRNRKYRTRFSVFRWGNVVGSRGSVIQAFAHSLETGGIAHITDPNMSRFWIRIEDAVDFMLSRYQTAALDEPCIPPIRSASVLDVISAIAAAQGSEEFGVITIGMRKGEKLHESLVSSHLGGKDSSQSERIPRDELIKMVGAVL